jgi:hypothetical protein
MSNSRKNFVEDYHVFLLAFALLLFDENHRSLSMQRLNVGLGGGEEQLIMAWLCWKASIWHARMVIRTDGGPLVIVIEIWPLREREECLSKCDAAH